MMPIHVATAYAPASVGNVAVGFDLLGHALEVAGDQVTAIKKSGRQGLVQITEIYSTGNVELQKLAKQLPLDAMKNTAGRAVAELLKAQGNPFSVDLRIEKGIPLSAGMGGSAASAVAAVVATNALLDNPLAKEELLHFALLGESVASGAAHADNIAPSLFGGLCLALEKKILPIPVPDNLLCVLVHPHISIETKMARTLLNSHVPLTLLVEQSGYLAGFIHACHKGDIELLGSVLKDVCIEPQRSQMIPGFNLAKSRALSLGAIGFSISGAGPSVFAWTDCPRKGQNIQAAVVNSFAEHEIKSDSWLAPIGKKGAMVLSTRESAL
jgi:homoserine kinase